MNDRQRSHEKSELFFERMWKRGDPWELETSVFERTKYEREIAVLDRPHYDRVLELGCGMGSFTRSLARHAGRLVGLDVAPTAIARAKQRIPLENVEFRLQNVMDYNLRADGPWDLVILNETIHYMGLFYTFFDVSCFAEDLFAASRAGGELMVANTSGGGAEDDLPVPSIVNTYHDLFDNVGYVRTSQQIFNGIKNGSPVEVMISLFTKPGDMRRP